MSLKAAGHRPPLQLAAREERRGRYLLIQARNRYPFGAPAGALQSLVVAETEMRLFSLSPERIDEVVLAGS